MIQKTSKKSNRFFSFFRQIFERLEGRIALTTGVAASLSFFLGLKFSQLLDRPDTLVSGLWCVMTTIVVLQAHLGGTYKAAWIRFLGVLVGCIMGGLFTNLFGSNDIFSLGLAVFLTIIICSLINIKDSFRIATLSVVVIMVLWGLKPFISPWTFALFRFLDSCLGIIVAVFVSHVIWPEKATNNLKQTIAKSLVTMSKFYRLSATFEIESEKKHTNAVEETIVEIEDLLKRNREFLEASKSELLIAPERANDWTLVVNQLEIIFESIISLSNIPKDTLTKIFDDSLANQVADVIDKTDLAFYDLEKMVSNQKGSTHIGELSQTLTALTSELSRFRGTRTTRKFNLEDVENFFVFFYNLRFIAEGLKKMSREIEELYVFQPIPRTEKL
jgi:uncharacterized membrane protein YgaE (UPF0421/DUF939 family)